MAPKRLNRRSSLTLLSSGAAYFAFSRGAAAAPIRVRQNFTEFAKDPKNIAALKQGVTVMKKRSDVAKDDPTGWYYWAASHGTSDPIPAALKNVYFQCQHGTPHFISWHRAFLYYFEQTLRAASGYDAFNLPYWDWYADTSIPSAFTSDNASPLYHSRTHTSVTGLSHDELAKTAFLEFSGKLEDNPHGTVHSLVGGDMGFINSSARDPIFWLHHCNIDRIWSIWSKTNHNPAPADPWSKQVFFFDVNKTMRKSAGEVTDSQSGLGYKYDVEGLPMTAPRSVQIALAGALVAQPVSAADTAHARAAPMNMPGMTNGERGVVASALNSAFSLGSKSRQLSFPLSQPSRNRVLSLAAPSAANPPNVRDVELVLRGVQITPDGRQGGYSYGVCVGIPAGPVQQAVLDRQCVGEVGSFTISVADQHMRMAGQDPAQGVELRFPISDAIKAAGRSALGENLSVTFWARHADLPTGKKDKTYISVKSAHLELVGTGR